MHLDKKKVNITLIGFWVSLILALIFLGLLAWLLIDPPNNVSGTRYVAAFVCALLPIAWTVACFNKLKKKGK